MAELWLVAKGFEEILKNSPPCSKRSSKNYISIDCTKKNGNWMPLISKLPFCKEKKLIGIFLLCDLKKQKQNVWLLKNCIYGLSDASHQWYNRVKYFFSSIGLEMWKGDPSIFYYYNDRVLQGLIAIFEDDFLWSGTNDFETHYISKWHKNIVIGKENHSAFRYLGLHLEENFPRITLDQMNYSENLKPIASNYDNEINSKDLLQSQIGKLLWMSGQTRDYKDITYPNKIVAHQKQETVQIANQNMGNECNLELSIFADASHDNLNDGWKSTRLFNYSSGKCLNF